MDIQTALNQKLPNVDNFRKVLARCHFLIWCFDVLPALKDGDSYGAYALRWVPLVGCNPFKGKLSFNADSVSKAVSSFCCLRILENLFSGEPFPHILRYCKQEYTTMRLKK